MKRLPKNTYLKKREEVRAKLDKIGYRIDNGISVFYKEPGEHVLKFKY